MTEFDMSSVKEQPVDFSQISVIMAKAERSLASGRNIVHEDPESAFTLAYESMLKASMALMFSRGYRPRVQLGHHKTLVNFAKYVLGSSFAGMTASYDRMRGKRNRVVYDIGAVSETEANEGLTMADRYMRAVKKKIEEENPQLKLL